MYAECVIRYNKIIALRVQWHIIIYEHSGIACSGARRDYIVINV